MDKLCAKWARTSRLLLLWSSGPDSGAVSCLSIKLKINLNLCLFLGNLTRTQHPRAHGIRRQCQPRSSRHPRRTLICLAAKGREMDTWERPASTPASCWRPRSYWGRSRDAKNRRPTRTGRTHRKPSAAVCTAFTETALRSQHSLHHSPRVLIDTTYRRRQLSSPSSADFRAQRKGDHFTPEAQTRAVDMKQQGKSHTLYLSIYIYI